jgi:hypothetical protein
MPSPNRRRAVEWLTERLNLNPGQAQQLADILGETRTAYHQHELQIEAIRQESNARIRAILSDEQKAVFDTLLKRNDAKRKGDRSRR